MHERLQDLDETARLERDETRRLRSLARSAQLHASADVGVVVVLRQVNAARRAVIFAPRPEVEGGAILIGEQSMAVTPYLDALLNGAGMDRRVGSTFFVDDATRLPEYAPLTSHEAALQGTALASASLWDPETEKTVGALIVRRKEPFTARTADALSVLEPIALATIGTMMPPLLCDRCELIVDEGDGLVAFVRGAWVAGHKRCWPAADTRPWYELSHVRHNPLRYTRETTSPRTLKSEEQTSRALTSWYSVMERVTGNAWILQRDDSGAPYPLHGIVAVRNEDEET